MVKLKLELIDGDFWLVDSKKNKIELDCTVSRVLKFLGADHEDTLIVRTTKPRKNAESFMLVTLKRKCFNGGNYELSDATYYPFWLCERELFNTFHKEELPQKLYIKHIKK